MTNLRVLRSGVLTEQWDDATETYTDYRVDPPISRPYNAEELQQAAPYAAAVTSAANQQVITDLAIAALASNRDYLALDPPTQAQALAQVKALTRQNNGIIRLLLRRLDGTD
jgi:hypothetical protein